MWKQPGDFVCVGEGEQEFVDDAVWTCGAGEEADGLGRWGKGEELGGVESCEGFGGMCYIY